MHQPKMCPACGSKHILLKEAQGFVYVCCKDCAYDEEQEYDAAFPGERNTQKMKTRYTPYKRGGSQRTRK